LEEGLEEGLVDGPTDGLEGGAGGVDGTSWACRFALEGPAALDFR